MRGGAGAPSYAESLREYGRGLAGGFLFSLPLLYTMEVWWTGVTVSPARLLVGLAGTFGLLCAYNAYAGLRHDSGLVEILIDSVEELGLGIAVSAGVLAMIGRLLSSSPASDVLGLVLLEGLFVAIGVSVGTAQLALAADDNSGVGEGRHNTLQAEVTLALCGAVLVAANVAPTEEVVVLAAGMSIGHLLGLLAVSLALAMTLLYFSNFAGSGRFRDSRSALDVWHGTVITYAAALAASAALLAFFDRFEGNSPVMSAGLIVVLALPATLGAAAGRLLLR